MFMQTCTHMSSHRVHIQVFKLTGFCPQLQGLYETLTVAQHVTLFLRLRGLIEPELSRATADVLQGYGLQEHEHKAILTLRIAGAVRAARHYGGKDEAAAGLTIMEARMRLGPD